MKSQWVFAGLVCCLSAQLSAEVIEATQVDIEAISIDSRRGVKLIASGVDNCDRIVMVEKEDNPYFKEQFSALLTSHKLKQPVDLKLKSKIIHKRYEDSEARIGYVIEELNKCSITDITVTR